MSHSSHSFTLHSLTRTLLYSPGHWAKTSSRQELVSSGQDVAEGVVGRFLMEARQRERRVFDRKVTVWISVTANVSFSVKVSSSMRC